jgi:hypothetical protein
VDQPGGSIETNRDPDDDYPRLVTAGMIETKESSTGRLVDVDQVREKAMGPVAIKRPSALQDRVADGTPERTAGRPTREQELAGTLLELQALARERMGQG